MSTGRTMEPRGGSHLSQTTLFSSSALQVIYSECQIYGAAGEETGGVLVGRRLDSQRILVIAATGPGPKADHRHHTFAPDTNHLNNELERLRSQYNGTDFVGFWHKHPPTLDHPSAGDEKQAWEVVNDPDFKTEEFVLVIAVQRNRPPSVNPEVKPYYYNRELLDRGAEPLLMELREVREGEARRLLCEVEERSHTWYDEPAFQRRLEEEIERLSDQYQLRISKLPEQVVITAEWRRDPNIKIYFVCKEGYPNAGSPQVFAGLEQEQVVDSRRLTPWHPEHFLAQIADDIVSSIQLHRQAANRPHRSAPKPPPPPTKTKSWLILIVVVALVLGAGGGFLGGFFVGKGSVQAGEATENTDTPSHTPAPRATGTQRSSWTPTTIRAGTTSPITTTVTASVLTGTGTGTAAPNPSPTRASTQSPSPSLTQTSTTTSSPTPSTTPSPTNTRTPTVPGTP